VALDRNKDALTTCEKIIELEPDKALSWHLFGRQLHHQGKNQEAMTALSKGLKLLDPGDLELAQQMHYELGTLQSEAKQPLAAAKSFGSSAAALQQALKELTLDEFQKKEIRLRLVMLYERIGNLHLDTKQPGAAAAAFQEAQKVDPLGGQRWHLNLAQAYHAQGKLQEALKSIDVYLKLQPQGTEAYALKIKLLDKLGQKNDILPWLNQAVQQDKFNVSLKMLLAEELHRHQQSTKAEQVYLDLLKENPKTEIYRQLFQIYKNTPGFGLIKAVDLINEKIAKTEGKHPLVSNQAKAQVKAILSALRESPALTHDLLKVALPLLSGSAKELDPQTIYVLAVLADQNNDLKVAEAYYRASLKKLTPQTEAVVYGGLLRVLWKGKKYEDMVALCKDGLQKAEATNHLLFHRELARAYARQNRLDLALNEAKKGVELATESSRLAMQRLYVGLLIQAKDYDKAESECQTLLRTYKQSGDIVEIRLTLANLYSAMRSFPKAENELQLVLKADPTNATACNDLGYLWADQGKNLKEAEELIRKALELDQDQRKTLISPHVDPDQDNAAFVDSLGWVLFRRGNLDDARKELERATKLPGGAEDPVVWDHLGDVYFKLGRTVEAQTCWQRSVTLYEDDKARPLNEHYKDLKTKIQLLKSPTP
jgi:tetratricopeptide (TPR) repeat protein